MSTINEFFLSINLMQYILEFAFIGCGIISIMAAMHIEKIKVIKTLLLHHYFGN